MALSFVEYANDPNQFTKDIWDVEPYPWQSAANDDAAKMDKDVIVQSGAGCGKTTWLSRLMIWFLVTHPLAQIPCTAPTKHHLIDLLWSQLHRQVRESTLLSEHLSISQTKLSMKGYEQEWFAIARTAKVLPGGEVSEGLQGFHGGEIPGVTKGYTLQVGDEACFDDETEILTDSGWRKFEHLLSGDRVLTMDRSSHVAKYVTPTAYKRYWHDGEIFEFKQRGAHFRITPNHRLYFRGQYDRVSGREYQLRRADQCPAVFYIPRSFKWEGVEQDTFHVAGFGDVQMDGWLRILGWYLSEGSLVRANSKELNYQNVIINQCKQENYEEIRSAFQSIGCKPFDIAKHKIPCGVATSNRYVAMELAKYGQDALTKFIPRYVHGLSPRQISIFLQSFLSGDGYHKGPRDIYYTSSTKMGDGLQELILKTGNCSSVTTRPLAGKVNWIKDHFATSSVDGLVVARYSKSTEIKVKRSKMKRVQYRGFVYCVSVPPTELIYTRRSGTCMWAGNTGLEDQVVAATDGTIATGEGLRVWASNPIRTSGFFYEACTNPDLDDHYYRHKVSCLDIPSINRRYIAEMKAKYGENSPIYISKVLGEFPNKKGNILFDAADCRAIFQYRNLTDSEFANRFGPMVMAVDVSDGGDCESVACLRRGPVIQKFETWKGNDPEQNAAHVAKLIDKYKPVRCYIDCIGVGTGTFSALKKRGYGKVIRKYKGSWDANDPEIFANKRCEGYFHVSNLVSQRVLSSAVPCERLIKDLEHHKQVTKDGIFAVTEKTEIRKRHPSPDFSDALIMTYLDELKHSQVATKTANRIAAVNQQLAIPVGQSFIVGGTGRFGNMSANSSSRFSRWGDA